MVWNGEKFVISQFVMDQGSISWTVLGQLILVFLVTQFEMSTVVRQSSSSIPPFRVFSTRHFLLGRCCHPVLTPTYLYYQKNLTIQKNSNRFIPTFCTVNYTVKYRPLVPQSNPGSGLRDLSLKLIGYSKTNSFFSWNQIPVTFSISSR